MRDRDKHQKQKKSGSYIIAEAGRKIELWVSALSWKGITSTNQAYYALRYEDLSKQTGWWR